MEMLRRPSAAVLGIPTDLSAEAVDVVTAAPQPPDAMTTSTTGSRLPLATSSSNSDNEEGAGRFIAARGFDRSEAVDASLDRRPVG